MKRTTPFLFLMTFLLMMGMHQIPKKVWPTENMRRINPQAHEQKEVVIFVYHRFGNDKYPSTNISVENFQQHLSYLKKNNFKVITFGEAIDYVSKPEIPYVEKVVCLTIDDGYKTFIQNAMPLLKKFGFQATLFINSESVGGGTYMDWNELKEVHQQGIEIGNHSHSHAYFLNLPKAERRSIFEKDIRQCQEAIKLHLGFYPDVFAYPYGEFDPGMKGIVKAMNFKASAAQNSGVMYRYDNFAIPRFPMAGPYVNIEGFIEKANMKALRVQHKIPESSLLTNENPPRLIISFDTMGVDLNRYNCFTTGACQTTKQGNTITLISDTKLHNRRTLYKITAPSKNGKEWHWFSHLWIQPEVKE